MLIDPRVLVGVIAATGAAAAGVWLAMRRRPSPEERERARRLEVNQSRRWIEGEIQDADERSIHYSYDFRGVGYSASQDVHDLTHMLPANPASLIGRLATVKFDPGNPANSIVVCEEWSGLPAPARGVENND